MHILAGGVYSKNYLNGKKLLENLSNIMSPAINGIMQKIETDFSAFFTGHRSSCVSAYYDFLKTNSSQQEISGFLIGNLYSKNLENANSNSVKILTPDFTRKVIATKGKFLSENYWGKYLLILQDNNNGNIYIFPDPIGYSSLFYMELEDSIFFSSDLWCLHDLLEKKAKIDSRFLVAQLNNMGGLLASNATAFHNIKELTHGNGLMISNGSCDSFEFWNPCQEMHHNYAQELILPTFFDVIKSQFKSSYNSIIFLSGGLDSSSLMMAMSSLKLKDHQLMGLTLIDKKVSSSNEKEWAEKVAYITNSELKSYIWEDPICLEKCKDRYRRFDKPHVLLLNRKSIYEQESIALAYQNPIFWSGHGGDQLFCEGILQKSISDFWIDNKFKGISGKIMDLCQLYRITIPFILKTTITSLYKYYKNEYQNFDLLNFSKPEWLLPTFHDYFYDEKIFFPYFIKTLKKCKPAKSEHILSVYEGVNQSKVADKLNRVPIIYPYYAQPFVELALSVPCYQTYTSSYGRAPFREEIARYFKTDLAFRRSKGETSGMLQRGIHHNINKIKELCLEGYFAREKMLNRSKLEKHISRVQHGKTEELHYLINLIYVEVWCNDWEI